MTSDLIQKIHRAQVLAGEAVVIESLREQGLAPPAPPPIPPLAPDHKSMRVDYRGLMRQAADDCRRADSPANAFMLEELTRNLTELGDRFYAGDLTAVDEFLQLFCIGHEARAKIAGK